MSVSKMKKLTVFVHKTEADAVVHCLVRQRCVDVSELVPEEGQYATERSQCDERRAALEKSVAEIEEAIRLLNRYAKKAKSLVHPKIRVNTDQFIKSGKDVQARAAVKETLQTAEHQNELKAEMSARENEVMSAEPYLEFDLPLNFSGTVSTSHMLGSLPSAVDLDNVGKDLYDTGAIADLISESAHGKYISVICHRSDRERTEAVLASYGFLRAGFDDVNMRAEQYVGQALERQSQIAQENEGLEAKFAELAKSLDDIEILSDREKTALAEVIQRQKTVTTDCTVMLAGWVPEQSQKKVETVLSEYDCAYDLAEPTEEDNPPILLENNGFAKNFEWVLGMYSYPAYGKFDPTFIMSIFYFIIFGIMFADAGYGLVLSLACFAALKLMKPGPSMERFLKMFGYCGISCIIFGILFGAYFGDLPLAIMRNMMGMAEEELPNLALLGSTGANVAVLFDPLQNPMGFLLVSLGIGAVHLIAGMAVKFVLLCKEGKVLDAILDIGAYWLLFAGIAMIFLLPSVGKWVVIAAVALIVLTHGRAEKNIIMKLGKGLLGLYDLISYASDLLSYSRILALGLAAGIIGQVVNILGTMMGPTPAGFIVLVLAFLVGHLLNIAINVLGTFVHTARLQYIEFFGKFYEDGGVEFDPALPSEQYTSESTNEQN